MQYKDTSQQAFLIIYLICILSFIYFSLGRSRWVSHFKRFWLRLMSDSEVNRLKMCAFTFSFESLPPSSCLSHLTHLVSYLSLRDKWNLICDVKVCAGKKYVVPLPWGFIPHPPAPAIYSLFVHISDERQRDRPTNKSLENCIYFIRLVKSIEFIDRIMSTFSCQHGIKCHKKKKLYRYCNPYFYSSCQDTIRLG